MVYLVKMLERSNVELLILATTFLKKLSIYKVRHESEIHDHATYTLPDSSRPWCCGMSSLPCLNTGAKR